MLTLHEIDRALLPVSGCHRDHVLASILAQTYTNVCRHHSRRHLLLLSLKLRLLENLERTPRLGHMLDHQVNVRLIHNMLATRLPLVRHLTRVL